MTSSINSVFAVFFVFNVPHNAIIVEGKHYKTVMRDDKELTYMLRVEKE